MSETQTKLASSVNEAAEKLSVSRDSVVRAIQRGDLKAIRFGKRVLIPASELKRILGE